MRDGKDEGINYLSVDYIETMVLASLGIILGLACVYQGLAKLHKHRVPILLGLRQFLGDPDAAAATRPLVEVTVEEEIEDQGPWVPWHAHRRNPPAGLYVILALAYFLVGVYVLAISIEAIVDVNLPTNKDSSDSEKLANSQEIASFFFSPMIKHITPSSPAPVATAINSLSPATWH